MSAKTICANFGAALVFYAKVINTDETFAAAPKTPIIDADRESGSMTGVSQRWINGPTGIGMKLKFSALLSIADPSKRLSLSILAVLVPPIPQALTVVVHAEIHLSTAKNLPADP